MDTQTNCKYSHNIENKIIYKIPYPEALWMTINYHKTVGKYKF